ncbi:diguanylate cyclase [Wenzhouxiangella sp. XN79A]|uniref:sensor domain-containing diguanylate cyclase n=1 Tax=Wenzhouxiangella sp. XN79A TaxID=2724193 RepID=UPI00144AE60C|nr:diguanylate cyclase [Wenzhouxiangella sp. XN79A]NKI35581.1 diguanylate cyclase [Wenzhouxiangella sp. XN79A]
MNSGTSWTGRAALRDTGAAVLAFVLNVHVLFPMFGELTLHLGQAVSLLALLLFGVRAALIAAVAAGLGLWWSAGAWIMPLLFVLETAVIAALVARGRAMVPAAVLFWLLLGLPLNYLMATLWLHLPADVLHISVIKQAINGLLNASLAAGAFQLLVNTVMKSPAHDRRQTSLLRQTFAMSVTLVVLPALLIALFLVNRAVDALGQQVERRLQQQAQGYALLTEMYLDRHQTAIRLLVERFPGGPASSLNQALDQVQQAHPGFLTMVVTDATGDVVHGAPATFYDRVADAPAAERSVADRDWFRVPRETGDVFLSDGFIGRGFGSDPIVAVSAPLVADDGRFLGVVEGSLNLPRFADLEAFPNSDDFMLIVDRAGQRIHAPDALEVPILAPVELPPAADRRLVDIAQVELGGDRFFVADASTIQGWTVYALTRTRVLAEPVERFVVAFGLGLLGLIALGGWVARVFATGVTRPLATLSEQILDPELERIRLPADQRMSPEIVQVCDALDRARQLSLRFQHELEKEVVSKTAELRALNRKLGRLAIGDPLTGLLNRRGFEIKAGAMLDLVRRESLGLVVAMIDIDRFKAINDAHGHAAGDECLRKLAEQLREAFQRRGDLIARIGGEEFAVLAVTDAPEAQFARLEQFRSRIEQQRVELGELMLTFTVSIGAVASIAEADSEIDELLDAADQALYASKRAGRNRLTEGSDGWPARS